MVHHRLHAPLIAAAAACTLLVHLGGPALWDDDEPKNAACSLAMLDSGDWIVPTFNGRLRVEKPPLVNWVQLAGFAACGRNETGARIGSALLTIGTCLLTWRIGCLLLDPAAGLVGGLAMATCIWTAVGGRAATPDAPLAFCTTLALWLCARGCAGAAPGLSRVDAAAVGAACGLAALAKGPVGVALPVVAFLLFAGWRRLAGDVPTFASAVGGLRLPAMLAAALAVALPWYLWVGVRTGGAWPRGFFLVHNVGRFMAPMEGHSGSFLYYPAVVAVGLFPWSIVLAAMVAHAVTVLLPLSKHPGRRGAALLACWAAAWIGIFSCSGTKLPGYVWPAYPALALLTGLLLVDWARDALPFTAAWRDPARGRAVVMRVAWATLGTGGVALAIGLVVAARLRAPGAEWLGLCGLVPIAAAWAAWRCDAAGRPRRAIAVLTGAACLLVGLLAGVATDRFSRAQGMRESVARLAAEDGPWACFWNVPPTVVFYARSTVAKLETAADVARHLASHPHARVVIDSRHEAIACASLPPDCTVLARIPTLDDRHYVVFGPPLRENAPLAVVP
ncbi:MAG: phospholipid carrier-dependent glycosyltransferase [Planctomycetia bacterium]|nr:phospholipid carrier-dependent glycosyltransferase [Planctomycetia bacterium]